MRIGRATVLQLKPEALIRSIAVPDLVGEVALATAEASKAEPDLVEEEALVLAGASGARTARAGPARCAC